MKIIGLFVAWAAEDWVDYSIRQSLEFVDELIISIGPFHTHLRNIEDNTFEIAKNYFNNKKTKFISSICLPENTINQNRCITLNKMIEISDFIEEGNLIWLLDTDEFYSKEAINEIKSFIKKVCDFDEIQLITRMFCMNFNYYVKTFPTKIFKITNQKPRFISPIKLSYKSRKNYVLLRNNPIFNYSLLTGEQTIGIKWILEKNYKRFLWLRKIYNKYDPENETYWMEKNEELSGKKRFFYPTLSVVENFGYGLMTYEGKHPEIIENSSIKKILDFRDFTKRKNNYQSYLKTVKTIILEKKKFKVNNLINIFFSHIQNLYNKILIKFYPYLTKKVKKRIKHLIRSNLIVKKFNYGFQIFKKFR